MKERVCIVRKGHMGDVILSEPIAASLIEMGSSVSLCTEYEQVGRLLSSYSTVHPYADFIEDRLGGYDRVHVLRYELHPHSHYLDAYSDDIGVRLVRRRPKFKVDFPGLVPGRYGLIAPHTSGWMQAMRSWPAEHFAELSTLLAKRCDFPWRLLQPQNTFDEMMSLIAHAAFFIGNDSGPAVIAQALSIPSVVIFGATNSAQVLFESGALGITNPVGCNGCRHITRHTEMECNTPICIHGLSVDSVLLQIERSLDCLHL